MKFNEFDLEEAIWQDYIATEGKETIKAGLPVMPVMKRQCSLGNYGIADLVLISKTGLSQVITGDYKLKMPDVDVVDAKLNEDLVLTYGDNTVQIIPIGSSYIQLVVEDNILNRKLIKKLLEIYGIKVDIADNGKDAVNAALKNHYDIIFMDIQLPEMDGYTTTRILRKKGYKNPIIAITAYAVVGDKEKCIKAGCNDYLAKPIKMEALGKCLKKFSMIKTE